MKEKTKISRLTIILLFTILISLLFPKILIWFISIKSELSTSRQNYSLSQTQILNTLSSLLTDPMETKNKKRIAKICNSFFELGDIVRIEIKDEKTGMVLYERVSGNQNSKHVLTSHAEIVSRYEPIGQVILESRPPVSVTGLSERHLNSLYLFITELLLSLALISLVVYHYILLPLFNMSGKTLRDRTDIKKRYLFGFSIEELNEDISTIIKRFKKYRTIVDQSVIVLKVDGNCRIHYVTKALCKISGYKNAELIDKSLDTLLLNKTELDRIKDKLIGVRKAKHTDLSIQCVDQHEKVFWLGCHLTYDDQEAGDYTFYCENITDKKEVEFMTVTDKLTGLKNRNRIVEILSEKRDMFIRYKHYFSIIILDIDQFKDINTNHGHQSGDRVLSEIADLVRSNCRETDIVGRWEGAEFLIICPNTRIENTQILAENLREKIESHSFNIAGTITSSLGISEVNKNDLSCDTLIQRADLAIYQAKKGGRNKVGVN